MSRQYISNTLQVPQLAVELLRNLRTQKSFIHHNLRPFLETFEAENPSTAEIDYDRITNYYALAVPSILGEIHCLLYQRKMSHRERKAATFLGACSVLFDDFFDSNAMDDNYISALINDPKNAEQQTNAVKLATQLYIQALEEVHQPQIIQQALNTVFQEQIRSRKQKESDTSDEEIQDITFRKGGAAFLLYRNAFDEVPSQNEERFYSTLGAIMQIENDIFDAYKDRQAGIKTLATASHDLKIVRNLYLYLINELFDLYRQLNLNPAAANKSMRKLMLVICRGLVCLDQLQKLQRLTNDRFEVMAYTRSELICDMEKPSNLLKTIHYYAKFHY